MTLAAVALSASAVNPADFPDLEPGKEYTLKAMKPFQGKYTSTANGQVIEYAPIAVWTLAGNELQQITEADGFKYAGFINGKQAYQFPVKAGEAYYFYDSFVMDDGIFMFELNPELSLLSSTPAVGEVYDPAARSSIELVFNQNLNIGKATLSVKDLTAEAELHTVGSTVSVSINDALRQWYNEGKISGNEKLNILLSEITDGLGKQIDDMSFSYLTAHTPVELVSAELPIQILSWYSDDSESAKAVFTFSGPMAQNPRVELCYAPVDLGYEYTEPMEAIVEGNSITVDFGGKRRTSAEMSTSGRTDKNIYLCLIGLKDATGQVVWSDAQGSVGSYMYDIPFAEISRLNITSEFTPSLGASLENAKSLKIYFNCADHLTYSGVAFTSGDDKVIVDKSDISVDRISDSEVELTVPIPAGWNTKKDVIVTLDGLTADDGYDHSADISAKYNGFTLLFCSIKDGSRVKALSEGAIVKVETNLSEGTKLTFEINDVFGPVEMKADGDGVYSLTMPETLTFEVDKAYTINFTAENQGTESLTIIGDTAPYEFSDIVLESVTPEASSALTPDAEVKLTFSGLVFISEMPVSAPFTATPAGNDESGYDFEWTIKFADASVKDLVLAFSAKDLDGKVIEGNQGIDAASYFLFVFNPEDSSISQLRGESTSEVYDLQGRRILAPAHGLYIKEGKVIRL